MGYHIIKQLRDKKHQIAVLDRDLIPEESIRNEVTFFHGDVRDSALMDEAVKESDFVIHAAASLPLESAEQIRSTTIFGTRNALESSLRHGVKRMVYISSSAVYGVPEKHPIEETDPMVGVGPYGIAKIEAEKLCAEYREKGLVVPVIRPKTFIGTERLGVFQILFNWVREGHRIPLIGNGHNRYQLLEVEDLVRAILLMTTAAKTKVNDVFNVGAEEYGTVYQDIMALCEYAGSGARPWPIPSVMVKPALRGLEAVNMSPLYRWVYDTADKDSFLSVDKIKQLGWSATRSNAETLINAYQWYLEHYEDIESMGTGTAHRTGWDQGALGWFKKFL